MFFCTVGFSGCQEKDGQTTIWWSDVDVATPTGSEGFGAFPPELLGRCPSVGVLLESGPEHFGREVVAVGRHLPQRSRLVDDLTDTGERKHQCGSEGDSVTSSEWGGGEDSHLQTKWGGVVSCPRGASVEHVQQHAAAAPHVRLGGQWIPPGHLGGHVALRAGEGGSWIDR